MILESVLGMHVHGPTLYDHLPSLPVRPMILADHCTRVSRSRRSCRNCTLTVALW